MLPQASTLKVFAAVVALSVPALAHAGGGGWHRGGGWRHHPATPYAYARPFAGRHLYRPPVVIPYYRRFHPHPWRVPRHYYGRGPYGCYPYGW